MLLTKLANEFGTDKGSAHSQGHGYTLVYDMLFAAQRDSIQSICEIGLSRGGPEVADGAAERDVLSVPSVRMWHDYFPQASVVGVDISDCSDFENDWFKFVQADCGNGAEIDRVADLGKTYDIILDDASHASYHQQLTFLHLFPLLKPGGVFIIEDLNWQPETYSTTLPPVPRTDELLEQYLRHGEFRETGSLPNERWNAIVPEIETVLTFDEEWLAFHRRQANARLNVEPEYRKRIDHRQSGNVKLKQAAAAMLRTAKRELSSSGPAAPYPKMQLAVIRKKAAPATGPSE